MAEHVNLVERKTGVKITRLRPDHDFDYDFSERVIKRKDPTRTDGKGYGWPSVCCRWCTRVKTETISRYLRTIYPCMRVVQSIGFAVGEERRLKGRMAGGGFRFPLIEYNIDEREALIYCKNLGYTWGGLYDYFGRVSCFCCPLQSRANLMLLKRHFPDLYGRCLAMDDLAASNKGGGCFFKRPQTLHDLDHLLPGK